MQLADLIGYVGDSLERIKTLDRQKDAEWDKVLEGVNDHLKRAEIHNRYYDEISGKYGSQMEAIREEISTTVRNNFMIPPGVTVEKIEACEKWGSEEKHPAKLELWFLVDPNITKKLEFGSAYVKAYKLRQQVPALGYSATLYYDAGSFLNDYYFDPRAFRGIKMSKKGQTFSPIRFLERKDLEGTLEAEYDPSYKENRSDSPHGVITVRAGYDNKVWSLVLKEVARKFEGTCQIHIPGSDYARLLKEKSIFNRIKANVHVRGILEKRTTSRAAQKITKAIVAYAAGAIIDRDHSWENYEGIITVDQLEKLEQVLGTSMTPFVNTVAIPAEVREDHRKVRETLRELAAYLDPIQVTGTSPGQFRITEEQVRRFLDEDLEAIQAMTHAVPLGTGFIHRGMGRVVECSEHDRLHLPLLRKLRELTTLDLESCVAGHSYDFLYSRFSGMKDPSEVKADKYHMKSPDSLVKEFQRVGLLPQLQEDTLKILETRKEKYWKDGFLTIHELYNLHISLLQNLQRSQPEVLLQRYHELYRDIPATSLSISGSIDGRPPFSDKDKPSEFPQPFIMNQSGSLWRFGITDGADSLDDNEISLYDNKLHITIIPGNPCLLPLQQSVLETIGVRISNQELANLEHCNPAPR